MFEVVNTNFNLKAELSVCSLAGFNFLRSDAVLLKPTMKGMGLPDSIMRLLSVVCYCIEATFSTKMLICLL